MEKNSQNTLGDILEKCFNFDSKEKKIAFIENLYLAGYFKDEQIWQALNLMQFNKQGEKVTDLWQGKEKKVFLEIKSALDKANTNQDNPEKFSAEYLLNNLYSGEILSEQNIENLIIYLCQNAFGRSIGQERNELKGQDWMGVYKKQYLENANKLGMIDEIKPSYEKYDESWIMGASRSRIISRAMYLDYLIKDQKINPGIIRLLTGERELWAEIDNINNDIDEAKKYMFELATENGIKVNKDNPFIIRDKRTYLNYEEGENKKVTEIMMGRKEYEKIFGKKIEEKEIINSKTEMGKVRPDTCMNAKDVSTILEKRIENEKIKDPKVLIVSNQPYAERQKIANERTVLKETGYKYNITFNATGEKAEVGVPAIHSEFAALISEKFFQNLEKTSQYDRMKSVERLMYSTRCNNLDLLPKMPIPKTIISNSEVKLLNIEEKTNQIDI